MAKPFPALLLMLLWIGTASAETLTCPDLAAAGCATDPAACPISCE